VEPSQGARSHPAEIAPSLVEVRSERGSKHILFQNYIGDYLLVMPMHWTTYDQLQPS